MQYFEKRTDFPPEPKLPDPNSPNESVQPIQHPLPPGDTPKEWFIPPVQPATEQLCQQ